MDATQCDSSALDETDIDQDFAVGHRFDGDAIDFESMGEFPLASDDIDVRHVQILMLDMSMMTVPRFVQVVKRTSPFMRMVTPRWKEPLDQAP